MGKLQIMLNLFIVNKAYSFEKKCWVKLALWDTSYFLKGHV